MAAGAKKKQKKSQAHEGPGSTGGKNVQGSTGGKDGIVGTVGKGDGKDKPRDDGKGGKGDGKNQGDGGGKHTGGKDGIVGTTGPAPQPVSWGGRLSGSTDGGGGGFSSFGSYTTPTRTTTTTTATAPKPSTGGSSYSDHSTTTPLVAPTDGRVGGGIASFPGIQTTPPKAFFDTSGPSASTGGGGTGGSLNPLTVSVGAGVTGSSAEEVLHPTRKGKRIKAARGTE